jgi:hypothetical protein
VAGWILPHRSLSYTDVIPEMQSPEALLALLVAIVVLWFILKLAKLAIRVILFVITVAVVGGAIWFLFMR